MEGVVFGEKPFLKVREVRSSAISPDGTKLALGFESGHVHVHDTSNWNRLHTLTEHTQAVRYLAFSCSGFLLASAGWESVIFTWFLSGREYNLLQGNSGSVRGISFSPDGNLLVSAYSDGSIWIWDAHSATALSQLNDQHPSFFHLPVSWSSDGMHVATVESSFSTSDMMLWQAKTGECERVLANGIPHVQDIAYSPVGQLLVAACRRDLYLWDLRSSGRDARILRGHTDVINSVVFSQYGQWILSSSSDRSIRLWDARTGSLLRILTGHYGPVQKALFLNDREIVSSSVDGTVRFWEINSNKETREGNTWEYFRMQRGRGPKGRIHCLAYSSRGDIILSSSEDMTLRQWNAETGHSKIIDHLAQEEESRFSSPNSQRIAFSPSGKQVAIAGGHLQLRVYSFQDDATLTVSENAIRTGKIVTYSQCGRWLASGDQDGVVRLWDLRVGSDERVLGKHWCGINNLAFSLTGHQLATRGFDNTLCLWDTENGECTETLLGHYSFCYSPCGTMIAMDCMSGCYFRDVHTGKKKRASSGPRPGLDSMAWSPCGRWLVSSQGCTVCVWRIRSVTNYGSDALEVSFKTELLRAFVGDVTSIAWSPAWSPTLPMEFVTGSEDSSVCVWRLAEDVDGSVRISLVWGSFPKRLVVTGAKIADAIGLDDIQRELLQQLDAIDVITLGEKEPDLYEEEEYSF